MHDGNMAQKIKKVFFSPSDRDMVQIIYRRLLANMPIIRKDLAAENNFWS